MDTVESDDSQAQNFSNGNNWVENIEDDSSWEDMDNASPGNLDEDDFSDDNGLNGDELSNLDEENGDEFMM